MSHHEVSSFQHNLATYPYRGPWSATATRGSAGNRAADPMRGKHDPPMVSNGLRTPESQSLGPDSGEGKYSRVTM